MSAMTQQREKDENIKVLVRIRPPSEAEKASGGYRKAVFATEDGRGAFLASPGSQDNNKAVFSYDNVVDEETSQEKVFELVGKPIADAFLKGYHSNLLAYGQTGAGKTYTMQGATEDPNAADPKAQMGLLPRALEYVFSSLEQKKQEHEEKSLNYTYGAQVSHLEIYNEVIFDLLDQNGGGKTITVREDGKRGVKVDGCSTEDVYDASEAFNLFKSGCESRHVGQTAANRESSRSHSVFILTVTQKFTDAETGLEKRLKASFYLVDLAGSERQKHSEAVGQTLKEACGINKSLSTLGNVIKSLVDIADGKERHIPYRDSKLTFLLKNSFGGMSKCSFVANVSPSVAALEETLSTLKFAQRAKTVKNTSSVCEETIGSVVALQAELKKVKAELLSLQSEGMSQISLGSVVQNLDEESSKHLEKVRKLLTYERESHASEKEKLSDQVESLQGLAKKLETSLKSTKLVVRLREQNLERLQSKLPPAPEAFWGEQGGAAIKENEQLKVQLECHPEVVKCRMEIESLQKENAKLKKKLETDVESQIFVFEENAKTAMEELHFLLRDRENLQTSHQDLNKQFNQLKEENFIDLQNAHEKLESVYKTSASLQEANDLLELECTELKAKITSLESTVKSASLVIEKTQSAFEQVQADLLAHTEMYDQLNDQVQTITNAYELLQEQKETVEASFESFKSEMDAQKQAHTEECGQLNDQIKTIQEQKETVEASFESFKSEMDVQKQAHTEECGQLNDQIKTIQGQKETVEASFESFKSEMDVQKQAHSAQLVAEKETFEHEMAMLKENHKTEMDAATVKISELQALVKDLEMKAARIESEESAYVGKLEVLENRLIEKQELLTGAEESKKEAESDRDQLAQAVSELERTCEELQNEASAIRAANSESMEDLKSKLSAATTKYEEAVHENDRVNAVADSLTSELALVKQGQVELEESLKTKIADLEHGLERTSAEKSEVEKALEEAKEGLSANDNNAAIAKNKEAKIRNLENALKKAQEAEAELKMKSRESLSSCNTALEEIEKLNNESQAMKATEEDLRAQITSTNDELGRFKQLYTESQGERKALEKEKESLLSQIDAEAEKRQAAIMTKVQSESKLSEVREEALELRKDLESQLKSEKMVSDQLKKKVRQLELDAARSQSPSTPPNDENVLRSSSLKMGSAHRKPFGEISNKIKSIELTPTRQEGKSKAADKSKQLHQVKAHLSAIENAITSRSSSRYALRTRNRVTYKE